MLLVARLKVNEVTTKLLRMWIVGATTDRRQTVGLIRAAPGTSCFLSPSQGEVKLSTGSNEE